MIRYGADEIGDLRDAMKRQAAEIDALRCRVTALERNATQPVTKTVTKPVTSVTRVTQRNGKSNAERQRAYRARKSGVAETIASA